MDKDYYKILGVERNASEDQIHKAYLKKCKLFHPDAQAGKTEEEKKKAEEQMKLVNEANDILSDKQKRQYYDNFGTSPDGNNFGGYGQNIDPREFFRKYGSRFSHFSSMFDDFGDDMGGFGFNQKLDPNAPKDGRDIKIKVNLPLEDSIFGNKREFTINIDDPCEYCNGTGARDGKLEECPVCHGVGISVFKKGMMTVQTTCSHCQGVGYVIKEVCPNCNGQKHIKNKRVIEIAIPRGIDTGNCLRVLNEGEKGVNGGKNGNIYLDVNVLDNDIFKKSGLDLETTIYISPVTAILGDDIDVQTPWGLATLKIPTNTKNNRIFRIKDQGIRTQNNNGDLYVRVEIETITNITENQKKLLEKLKKTITDDNLESVSELKRKCKIFEEKAKTLR